MNIEFTHITNNDIDLIVNDDLYESFIIIDNDVQETIKTDNIKMVIEDDLLEKIKTDNIKMVIEDDLLEKTKVNKVIKMDNIKMVIENDLLERTKVNKVIKTEYITHFSMNNNKLSKIEEWFIKMFDC